MIESVIQPGAFVDQSSPIDWTHPLNRSLLASYAITPLNGWRGGLTLRDLVRGGKNPHDGTLANGPVWNGPFGRTGGYGSIFFDGSNDTITTASTSDLNTSGTAVTLACYFNASSWNATQRNLCGKISSSSPFGGYWLRTNGAGIMQGGLAAGGSLATIQSSGGSTSTWYYITLTYDGAAVNLYINGTSAATAVTKSGSINSAAVAFALGSGINSNWSGYIADVEVWDRALSLAEHQRVYSEHRRGNPTRWQWVSTRAYSIPASSGGLLLRRRRLAVAA